MVQHGKVVGDLLVGHCELIPAVLMISDEHVGRMENLIECCGFDSDNLPELMSSLCCFVG